MGDQSLTTKIREELTAAMRSGDKLRLSTLRLLTAAVTNREKELGHELSDDEVRAVASKEMKKRTEAMEAFEAAGRSELATKERQEREVLVPYAPERLDETAVDSLIDEAIAGTGASSPGDLGKVMGAVMAKAKGRVDGAVVQAKVRARLEG